MPKESSDQVPRRAWRQVRMTARDAGARKRGPSGDLTAETRVRPVVTRYWPVTRSHPRKRGGCRGGARAPTLSSGYDLRSDAKRERPPPSIASEVRSPNRKRSGPLFRSAAIPAPRCTGPQHHRRRTLAQPHDIQATAEFLSMVRTCFLQGLQPDALVPDPPILVGSASPSQTLCAVKGRPDRKMRVRPLIHFVPCCDRMRT